jgi:cytidylate kinase
VWFQITDPADPADVAAVVALARASQPVCRDTVVVAVDGPSGSGKTTLARGVSDALDAPVVHMDELFPGWDGLAAAVPLLVDQVLAPRARGERTAYRVWDWTRDAWGPVREVADGRFLVIEGCGSSVGPAGAYAAVRVWVEAGAGVRRRRALARDGAAYEPHWQRWADQEEALFACDRTRERAHLVLDTSSA